MLKFERLTDSYYITKDLLSTGDRYVVQRNGHGEWMAVLYPEFEAKGLVLETGFLLRRTAQMRCEADFARQLQLNYR